MQDTMQEGKADAAPHHLDGSIYRKVAGHWLTGGAATGLLEGAGAVLAPWGLARRAAAASSAAFELEVAAGVHGSGVWRFLSVWMV